VEIVAFELLANAIARHVDNTGTYDSDWDSIKQNTHTGWVIDHDPFETNQVRHPYAGSVYYSFARSTGHDFWESLVYAFFGSALWEGAGEPPGPSLNDQITTAFGGSFLGETLFRMAAWWRPSGDGDPGFFRQAGAAIISPAGAVNYYAFDDRYGKFDKYDPSVYTRIGAGVNRNTHASATGIERDTTRTQAVGEYEMDYGLPGQPNYKYDR